jgi:hypothetical protein
MVCLGEERTLAAAEAALAQAAGDDGSHESPAGRCGSGAAGARQLHEALSRKRRARLADGLAEAGE